VVFYLMAYLLTNLAAFGVVAAFSRVTCSDDIASYAGMSRRSPGLALAMLVAFLIIKAAYELTLSSAKDLMDVGLPPEEVSWIKELIGNHSPQIHGFHQLRTRKAGHFRFIEFHLKVDRHLTVETSHAITEDLTEHIEEHFPNSSVMIHIEPCDGKCDQKCLEGCFLSESQREAFKN